MADSSTRRFPVSSNDYELFEEVGEGVSANVYKARCIPLNEILAVKILDLERCRNDLDTIRKEVHTMSLIDHPNLLKAHCSFIDGSSLWIVMPYMSAGSCFHVMKSAYPEGFEQPVIATLLREVLKALAYLHSHGHIHRDVKAGNILVDSTGSVKLGDFGVSACMFDSGERKRTRNTFVGTPCWMAPEVMQQQDGYDFKADIWSFGITALELAHGHAPFSKYPPMKVLLMTLQNAPPRLDHETDKKFSKSFKEIVAACLVKDPKKRPTSAKLLKHPFFKHSRTSDYMSRKILDGLSPLGERFRKLKEREAEMFRQNKGVNGDKEQLSQQEYIRGISAWNFDLDDLRRQAALIPDVDIPIPENQDCSTKENCGVDNIGCQALSPSAENSSNPNNGISVPAQEDETKWFDNQSPGSSSVTFPADFLQALGDPGPNHLDNNDFGSSIQMAVGGSTSRECQELYVDDKQSRSVESEKISLDLPPHLGQFSNVISGNFASILPLLYSLLQRNDIQKEKVTRLIKCIDGTADTGNATTGIAHLQISSSIRERDLQSQVISLQQSVGKLVEEVQRQKTANAQLERQISLLTSSRGP